jgi:hypothetical protein
VIRLDTFIVANEHAWCAPIAQLANGIRLIDVRKTSKCVKVPDRSCAPMPGLIQSLPFQALGRRSVEQVHRSHYRFSPELDRHASLLEQGMGSCHHSLVLALYHIILLW